MTHAYDTTRRYNIIHFSELVRCDTVHRAIYLEGLVLYEIRKYAYLQKGHHYAGLNDHEIITLLSQ